MATKLYIHDTVAPGYTPATIRGAWDATAGAVVRALVGALNGATIASIAIAEASATNNWDVLLLRGISRPLSGDQTISGTLTLILGVKEANIAANDVYHVHAYVTQGDSDTPRGTLLADSIGASEWPTTAAGLTTGALALDAVNALSGDRIVVEIGYQAQNTSTTSYAGTLYYGNPYDASDLTDADTDVTAKAGTFTFSDDLAFTEEGRQVAAVAIELDRQYDPQRRVTEEHVEVDRYYEPIKRQLAQEHVEVDRYYLPIKRQLAMLYIEIDVILPGYQGDVQLIAV